MKQAEHKTMAEQLISVFTEACTDTPPSVPTTDHAALVLRLAQVHATLATIPDPPPTRRISTR